MSKDAKKSESKAPKVTELVKEIESLKQALQHERADSINLSRRYDKQIADLRTVVKSHVVKDLLPVIDNFERALKHIPKDLEQNDYVKGVSAVVKQFEKTLSDMGVHKIKTVGVRFDPKYHEAVSMEEGEGNIEVVCEELQAGYQIGDHVIRHAVVRVKNTVKEMVDHPQTGPPESDVEPKNEPIDEKNKEE